MSRRPSPVRGVVAAALAVLVVLAGLVTTTAPAVATTTPPSPPPAGQAPPAPQASPPPRRLVSLLERVQRFDALRPTGPTGVAVVDGHGRPLATRDADRPLVPASTMKVMTAAAALRVLGPDHRFVTRVLATAAPDADGVVDGDLVLVGGGDPALASPTFMTRVDPDRPATPLDELARTVARAGVTAVTGRVIGDPSVLADEPLADGWAQRYLTGRDARRASGLTVDAGLRLHDRGGRLLASAADDPALRAARVLQDLLTDRGVAVGGSPGSRRTSTADTVEIARIWSPPLAELLTHTLRWSDNHLADGVFRMLGAATGDPTWTGGAHAVRVAFDDLDVPWDRLRLADGSGLSRANRLTAATLTATMHAMAQGPHRRRWLGMLAVAGDSGTMRRRLSGTVADGRVHGKTGTLRDVRALTATAPDGASTDLHVAVLANDIGDYGDVLAARRLADVLALAAAAHVHGCARPVRGRTGAPEAPELLICPRTGR